MSAGFPDLREFVDAARHRADLVEIDAEVDADQEIAEIHRRVIAAGGPVLLFRNVRGSRHPVVTNLFGTAERVSLAFGDRPGRFIREVAEFAHSAMPPDLSSLWGARNLGLRGLRVGTSRRRTGPVLDVAEPPRLSEIPLLKLWPDDGGHFMTLPLVLTQSPSDGRPNLGMYRIQRFNERETGIHWQIHKGGGFHYREAEQKGEALRVSIFAGGPPALILGAIAPLPEGIPELMLSSLVMGRRLPVVRVKGWPHPIPADCEFAFLGVVPPRKRRGEGPFGDHYGYYSLKHPYPVFRCRRVLRRRDAIWPATVVGKPRQEDYYLGDYLQDLLSPLFPLVMPSVLKLWSYGETGFHSLAAAVVRDRYPREAMSSAFRILGEGQLSLTKFLLVTDRMQDLRKFRNVLECVLERVNWETDLFVFSNISMDTLDYAGPEVNRGSKGVILALGEARRELAREFSGPEPGGARDTRVYCGGCLVVSGPSYEGDPQYASRLATEDSLKGWQLVVLCDNAERAAASDINFLWTTFTRFNPATDLHSAKTRIVHGHLARTGPVVLDARMKPWYPEEVFPDQSVAERVSRRWNEYFPGRRVEAGSSDHGDLTPPE